MAVAAMAVKKQRKQAEQRALQIQVKPEQVRLDVELLMGHHWHHQWCKLYDDYDDGMSCTLIC